MGNILMLLKEIYMIWRYLFYYFLNVTLKKNLNSGKNYVVKYKNVNKITYEKLNRNIYNYLFL